MKAHPHPRPLGLCILDGWGDRPKADDNAIEQARTPNWHRLIARWPHSHLQASEHYVGLPDGQMGNSEVGHTNMGAGRVVFQDLPRIDAAISRGELAAIPGLRTFINKLRDSRGTAHLMGLLSPGGVHSHQKQIAALARILAETKVPVAVTPFSTAEIRPPNRLPAISSSFRKTLVALMVCKSRRSADAITRWTATSAGTGSKRPIVQS